MAIHAEVHGHVHRRPFRGSLPFCDIPVTILALQTSQNHVDGMGVIDVVRLPINAAPGYENIILDEPDQLLLLLALSEPLLMTLGAGFDIRQSSEFVFRHILVAIHTFQALLCVF